MRTLRLVAVALSLCAAPSAFAATTIYTNEAAFAAAASVTKYAIPESPRLFCGNTCQLPTGVAFNASNFPFTEVFHLRYGFGYTTNIISFQHVSQFNNNYGSITGVGSAFGMLFNTYSNSGPSVASLSGAGFGQTLSVPYGFETNFFGVISDGDIGPINLVASGNTFDIVSYYLRADPVPPIDPPIDPPGEPTTGAVPEPATWAMMLVGFGAIGFAMRRKPRLAVKYDFA